MPVSLRILALLLLFASSMPGRAFAQIAPSDAPSTTMPDLPPAALQPTPLAAPQAFIRGWSFTSEIDESSIHPGKSIVLDPGHPEIILFFDSASTRPDTEFRYRLEGYDADWTVTRGRTAHYRRLTPGLYSFQVQSRLPGQSWPATAGTLLLRERPFFYQTW